MAGTPTSTRACGPWRCDRWPRGRPHRRPTTPPGRVRVHTLTPRGNHAVDLTDDVFWDPTGQPVESLVVAIQDVLTAVREASPD